MEPAMVVSISFPCSSWSTLHPSPSCCQLRRLTVCPHHWASLASGFESGPADWKPRKQMCGREDRDVRAFTSQALSLGPCWLVAFLIRLQPVSGWSLFLPFAFNNGSLSSPLWAGGGKSFGYCSVLCHFSTSCPKLCQSPHY